MLHKDFFRIILKLFGLYSFVICLFTILPQTIPQLMAFGGFEGIFYLVLAMVIPISLLLLLIFKPDLLINWLKLDKGFEGERIVFGELSTLNIIKLACIFIGGFLIIDSLPVLINQTFFIFKGSITGRADNPKEYYFWGVSFVKIFLGYFLVRKYELVGRILRTKNE
ncbi:MAG: hypothetical protein NT084_01650 [Bacteroidetes bacterium]|jgi:hypothetical protein|nr:hypothetical protein [Bacteroidota bacterium]